LQSGDAQYFTKALPGAEQWRVYENFKDKTAFLDIETTGCGGGTDHITAISLYGGGDIQTYVHGKNLNDFIKDVDAFKVLVTYNGKCFDVPFIEREFQIKLPHGHIDLRYILKSLGYKGGLKGCEKQIGLTRGNLEGVDGYFAVLLWNEYKRTGNERALETLIAYNVEDTVNLETLMTFAYNKKAEQTPFSLRVEENNFPLEKKWKADSEIIFKLKQRFIAGTEYYL
jgi:hypothetical protein